MLYNSPVKVYLSLLSCFILLFSFPSVVFAEDTFTYDANGNLVQDSASGRCFEYNGAHKLKKVTDCSGNTLAQYWYDDVGKKVKAVEGDVTTLYWSDEQVEVIGGPDHGNYTYFFANGERIARMNPNGSMYYYHNDHLGSTSVITDDQGNIVEKTKYYPYGEVRSGGNATAYLYNSKELDPITGQYDYRARPYDPTNPPRFTQPDPLLPDVYDPQSLNRYSYVKNNPIKYTDPTGESAEEALATLVIIGGISGYAGYILFTDYSERQQRGLNGVLEEGFIGGTTGAVFGGIAKPTTLVGKGLTQWAKNSLLRTMVAGGAAGGTNTVLHNYVEGSPLDEGVIENVAVYSVTAPISVKLGEVFGISPKPGQFAPDSKITIFTSKTGQKYLLITVVGEGITQTEFIALEQAESFLKENGIDLESLSFDVIYSSKPESSESESTSSPTTVPKN